MIIPSGYGQANLKFTGDVLPTGAEMTFGFDNQSSAFVPAFIADIVAAAFGDNNLDSVMVAGVTLSAVLIKLGPNVTGPSVEQAYAIDGTASGQSVGPNTAFLIHKNTNLGGRAGRGRMFQPGCSESAVDQDGQLNGTGAVVIGGLWDDFRDGMASADVPMVLLHGEGSPISTPTPIVTLTCDSRVATQRRRNRR